VSTVGRSLKATAGDSRLLLPLAVLGLIFVFDFIFIPGFFDLEIRQGHLYGSLVDILRNSAPIILLAIGMTVVIATGGVDLSVGAVMAISASVAAILIDPRKVGLTLSGDITAVVGDPTYTFMPLPVVIAVALFAALLCGIWNGALVAYVRIQPMVATLILMIAGRGIAQLSTNSVKINIFNDAFAFLGNGFTLLLPFSLFIVLLVFLGSWLLLRRTALGLFVESVGISSRASLHAGIKERRIKMFAYVFCALCAGVAGLVAVSSIRTSDANVIGLYTELDAILAVVIGGTVLGAGGRFSLLGSVIGALVIQATMTSMYHIGVPASAITVVKAIVVVVVIVLYSEQAQEVIRRAVNRTRTRTQKQAVSP
jgi:simple sugar transport system permease protein